jgi:hypothetical protein
MKLTMLSVTLGVALGACAPQLEKARTAVDTGTAVAVHLNNEAIYQADVERKRLRAARCLNPMLTLNAVSVAANDPRLGAAWIDELLHDCPQVASFISSLALRKVTEAGLVLPEDK